MSKSSNSHGWFIADIAIASTTLWLCLWRFTLVPQAGPEATIGVWGTWAPVAAIPALVVVAAVIGALRPKAVGFLPYVLRWVFAACGIGLLVWIAIDIAGAPAREPKTLVGEGVKAEREVQEALASAPTPQKRQRLEQAMSAAQAGKTLGIALEQARRSGVEVPGGDSRTEVQGDVDAAEDAPPNSGGMQEITALLLEYGDELASGQVPEEVSSFLADAGIDDEELLKQAALFLVSQAIAHYFGAPYLVVFELLVALLDDGELTLGELVRVGAACGMSVTADGGLDAELLLENFERIGVQAGAAVKVLETLEGADIDVPEEMLSFAKEMAGEGSTPSACDEAAIGSAFEAAGCDGGSTRCEADRVDAFLQHSEASTCRRKARAERRALILEYVQQHRPDLAPEFERAWR